MLIRKSSKGRVYYGCEDYKDCKYMTWDEPVAETCPKCGKTLFKMSGRLYCAGEGCDYEKVITKGRSNEQQPEQ